MESITLSNCAFIAVCIYCHVTSQYFDFFFLQTKPTRCTPLLTIFISTSLHVSGNYVPIISRTCDTDIFHSVLVAVWSARCTLLLSIFISTSLHVSCNCVPIIRRTYSIYATLIFFTLYGWLSGLLGAHFFLVYLFQLLYMFRATVCSSSEELTLSMRHWYFSLCMGGCLVCCSRKIPVSHRYTKFS